MLSYAYMRILESRPRRYDTGIRWLSFGQAQRYKHRIVADTVTPGVRMLDIGAGTGTLAILAAERGASVLGFDVSAAMLEVAEERVGSAGLENRIELRNMGVGRMDGLPSSSFDRVVASLVLSELSVGERAYTLHHAYRLLRPGGLLVVADETKPRGRTRRLIYHWVRIPLVIITFVVTQTTTKPVEGLEQQVETAGFRIAKAERGRWDAFLYLIAVKDADT